MNNIIGQGVDENKVNKITHVKKMGATTTTTEPTKLVLRDMQNRVPKSRIAVGKEATKKDIKGTAIQGVLKTTQGQQSKKSGTVATNTNKPHQAVVSKSTVLTRSNSMRVATATTKTTAGGIQRNALNVVNAQNKPKTIVTTKMVEHKVQQVKYITKTTTTTTTTVKAKEKDTKISEPILRREDSNLSRKSLDKFKALALASTKQVAKISNKEEEIKNEITETIKSKPMSTEWWGEIEDIDANDSDNLVLVSTYVKEIYDYLYSLEEDFAIKRDYLQDHVEITPKMRAILVDWINEVHVQFHLAPETFQIAVSIIDRYLQKIHDTKRSILQLVGVSALFIAAKYEELFPPAIADFVYITDDTYNAREIFQMELKIMKTLDYTFSNPQTIQFLRRFSKAAKAEDCHHNMSKYFVELSAVEYEMTWYKQSEIAAASLFLALHLLKGNYKLATGFNNSYWTSTLEYYSRYTADHLRPISKKIATFARNAQNAKLKAVYNKYISSKFGKIATRPELYSILMDSIISSKG